jgi:glutamate racemase
MVPDTRQNRRDAIGVFDSGVGGLTVVRRIIERLPDESVIYLGDTARVPYGAKSPATVIRYARACAQMLLQRGIKLLVVGCNTASACALEVLREELPIPVLGVIQPGARFAVDTTRNGRIGVIGTLGTVASRAYPLVIHSLAPTVQVFSKACPLFVPLAEEGWTEGPVVREVARAYLGELAGHNIDTLVLGCTHYPLLASVIAEVVGDGVTLVDSAEAAAGVVAETLETMHLAHPEPGAGSRRFLVSDAPETFARVGRRFLCREISDVEWVDF